MSYKMKEKDIKKLQEYVIKLKSNGNKKDK